MVSLVIVSHSATLAAGVQELAEQMVQGKVNIAVAGGIDDPEHPIGTDPMKVMAAIEAVYSDDGVVVLMDLGSALMSAETAVEFLMPEIQENVYLCPAPLIEGTMAAAVQASIGSSVEQVMAEAQAALAVKIEQIAPELAVAAQPATIDLTSGDTVEVVVPNRLGLHARPAARFVATASQFAAEMQVRLGEKVANAKSINQVATLGVRQNDTIVITALGLDAADALAAIQALAAENFGDLDEDEGEGMAAETAVPAVVGEWSGIPASPGIAIGPVFQYRPRLPKVKTRSIKNKQKQWQKLETAVAEARTEIQTLYTQAVAQIGAAEAAIFEAHDLFLADPDLLDAAKQIIYEEGINAEAAWDKAIKATAERYRHIDDAYMQARAADVLDVGQRVLAHLLKVERPSLDLKTPSILVAADLTPSDTAKLNPQTILGICVELGGATSHSAILARALGIPAIVGMGEQLTALKDGQQIGLNGEVGRIWVEPTADELADLVQKQTDWVAGQQKAKESAKKTAVTKDNRHIEVVANIGSPNDISTALDYGAEGVGLFRTEFLFLERETAPSEEEQYTAYRQAADRLQDRPIIIRTLDVGGDKPLPYLDQGREDNPFLGWRGIRFCLDNPEVFKPQIRAILRAGYQRNVKIMFPMVSTAAELKAAKKMVQDVQKELKAEKVDFDKKMEVGIMIEVPSAVAIADQLAKEADFFSIGTNDLTQYTMAADRGNANVAHLANALQPAVLRLIKQTVEAAHHADIWVGVCGELGGNDLATAVLVGLGVDELSMSAPAIPAVKKQIRSFTICQAQRTAQTALKKDSPEAVLKFLQK
ncbi:MAG: phosphoenolpyruvate--protein phosphotransferase [Chloroflexi bacterium]|nr:MAG: phosphoenolpyruvate--protein phosphotransferase [Chloroflexota bacterium]